MGDWDVVGTTPVQAAPPQANDDWDVVGTTPQMSGPARIPAIIGSNAAEGLGSVAAIPGDIAGLLDKGANWVGNQFGVDVRKGSSQEDPEMIALAKKLGLPDASASSFLGTPMLHRLGRVTGLWDRDDLQPQNAFERYIAAGSRGAGGAIPMAFGGGISAPLALGGGFSSGLGSEAGADIFPNHPVAGSLLGGLAGGLGFGGMANTIGRGVNAARGVGNDMTDAYATAGMTPRLAGNVSNSKLVKAVQAWAAQQPASAGRIAHAADQQASEFGTAADGIANRYGLSETPQDVGNALQGQSKQWMDNFKSQNATNWGALDGAFPNGVPVTNYMKALNSVKDSLKDAPATAGVLQSSQSSNLLAALKSDLANVRPGPNNSLSWQAVKNIRTRIGEQLEDTNLPADTNTAELKRIYAGLTKDMQGAATAASPQTKAAFDAANAYTSQGHNFIDQVLRPIMRQGTSPETAAAGVLSSLNKGGTVAQQLRDQMPQAADEVAAFKVRDMAAANVGRQNAAGDAVSPGSFLTDWNKLSPEAKSALFQDPAVKAKLDAMAKVSEGIKSTGAMANHSNTAAHGAMAHFIGTPARIMAGALIGHEFGFGPKGMMLGAAGAAVPEIGAFGAGRMMTSPRLNSYFAAPGVIDPRTGRLIAGLGTYAGMQQALGAPGQ